VEQVRALPEPPGGRYELHHGELVVVSFPKRRHWKVQQRLVELLKAAAGNRGAVGPEYPFRPLPEYEFWGADVAFVTQERDDQTDLDENLLGVPELVIEILSPSNTVAEMNDKKSTCLENGCVEFWVVDPKRRTVEITDREFVTVMHREGDEIPLALFGDAKVSVAEIFDVLN
jgi:Uma2 family endonuclease